MSLEFVDQMANHRLVYQNGIYSTDTMEQTRAGLLAGFSQEATKMALTTVNVLHVEDDPIQQRIISHHLGSISGHRFDVRCAASEGAALEEFNSGDIGLILLDYMLSQGNGLNCLREIRKADPFIPVIALSGAATPEIAADLLHAGADDYLSKDNLEPGTFVESVRSALERSKAVRERAPSGLEEIGTVNRLVHEACEKFASAMSQDFCALLDQIEQVADNADVSAEQLEHLFETYSRELDDRSKNGSVSAKSLLRPLMLELVVRLFSKASR